MAATITKVDGRVVKSQQDKTRLLLNNSIYVQQYITQHGLPLDSFAREVCCKQIGQGSCKWGSLGPKYSFDITDIPVSTDHFTVTTNRM